MADQKAGQVTAKVKRLGKELRNLQSRRTPLPVHAAASIFVRYDEDRNDKMRCIITGPEDTPYAFGFFVFDVFFPPDYPSVPPLILLENTGGGTARFNPNLYADGKVCLSLTGTWHGSDASEKWDPVNSSLYQILLSIQVGASWDLHSSLILINDPFYNEPSNESTRGLSETNLASNKYNADLHLNTIRYAIIDQLRNPRPGFEEVTRMHFKLLRHAVMQQCQRWLKEDAFMAGFHTQRLAGAVTELHGLLCQL
eukprot:jgi/Astpho2/4328/e_gw1.00065.64.1_t